MGQIKTKNQTSFSMHISFWNHSNFFSPRTTFPFVFCHHSPSHVFNSFVSNGFKRMACILDIACFCSFTINSRFELAMIRHQTKWRNENRTEEKRNEKTSHFSDLPQDDLAHSLFCAGYEMKKNKKHGITATTSATDSR